MPYENSTAGKFVISKCLAHEKLMKSEIFHSFWWPVLNCPCRVVHWLNVGFWFMWLNCFCRTHTAMCLKCQWTLYDQCTHTAVQYPGLVASKFPFVGEEDILLCKSSFFTSADLKFLYERSSDFCRVSLSIWARYIFDWPEWQFLYFLYLYIYNCSIFGTLNSSGIRHRRSK